MPARTPERPERKLTTRELFQQLPRALGLVWEADKRNAVLLSLLTLVQAGLPAAMAWVGKLIIDVAPRLDKQGAGMGRIA